MVKAKLFEVETQQGTLSTTMVNTKMGSKWIVGNCFRYRTLMSKKVFDLFVLKNEYFTHSYPMLSR